VTLQRTKDGYFTGANFPVSEKLAAEETSFDLHNYSLSPNARRIRWDQLMSEYQGKIDVVIAQRLLSDHYDTFTRKIDPNERTLCGHIDLSPRGTLPWQPPYGPAGAVQAKAADATTAELMSFSAIMGHPCGMEFNASRFLRAHREFDWQKDFLRDMDSHLWTEFHSLDEH
jgi:hypothetical protein